MFYGRTTLSTRTLLTLLSMLLLLAGIASPAFAANTGAAPQLVPFTVKLLAGNAFNSFVGGYGGDGGPGSGATLNLPYVLAVDAVGNVYFPDKSNAIIREISAQTGVISTIAGIPPAGGHVTSGCADGVPAVGNGIGVNMYGIAIDGYGNIFFSDQQTATISVIYHGGTQVANFIKLENPTAVTKAGGVLPGYVYHVGGTITLSSCTGTKGSTDQALAYQSASFSSSLGPLGLDSAGNLYVADSGVVRVINTQSTAQTFFGVTVQPGYVAAIVNCSTLTVTCVPGYGSQPYTLASTGEGGPAASGVFTTLPTNQGQYMSVDAYGNIYELNTKNGLPFISLATAYAGGAGNTTLANLLNNSLSAQGTTTAIANLVGVAGASGLTATAGDFYFFAIGQYILRPSSVVVDPAGNLYYQDNHYAEVYRWDVNAPPSNTYDLVMGNPGAKGGMFAASKTYPTPATSGALVTIPNPAFCYPINSSTTTTPNAGFLETDPYGDGCPMIYAEGPGFTSSVSGYGSTITDGQGNLYIADEHNMLIRQVTLNNIFPATPVGQPWNTTTYAGEQEIQVHFDQTNLPIQATPNPFYTTSSFAITPGITDFSINPISSNYVVTTSSGPQSGIYLAGTPIATASSTGTTSAPVCANETASNDNSLDCVVNVIFSPTQPGLRQNSLVVTTNNGSIYHYGLSGVGVGPQLAIDGGSATAISVSGLGNPGQIAVTSTGSLYIADPSNNRIVVLPAGGTQTTVGTGLKSPMGVAVDAAGNVFIADTGNNRVVEININTGLQTVLGKILVTGSPAYSSYAFNAPQSLVVDVHGNVYVADSGNAKVVMIPAHPDLGGAVPLLQYAGPATFTNPVGLALDTNGNIYVTDTSKAQVVEIPAGGGDFKTLTADPTLTGTSRSAAVAAGLYGSPSGIAVDGGGNVYVSDSSTNTVSMQLNNTGSASGTVTFNLSGIKLTGTSPAVNSFKGGSLALDPNGNLYIADSGNSRILFLNRQNPVVNYGTVAQGQPAVTTTFSVSNIGNASAAVSSPFTTLTQAPSASTDFASTNSCAGSFTSLAAGQRCTITTSFQPTRNSQESATVALNGSTSSISLSGSGEQPLVGITLSSTTPTANTAITITATLSPLSGNIAPTGSVSFSYTVNGTSAGAPQVVNVLGSSASFTIPASSVLLGRTYVISAVYSGDANYSQTTATPLTDYVPGVPVTVTTSQNTYTYVYGQTPPTITGTVTGIRSTDTITYSFTSAATSSTPIGTYPVKVVFSGTNYLDYGSPTVLTPNGSVAVVTETAAPLKVVVNSLTTQYGAPNLAPTATITGTQNGDQFVTSFTPANTSQQAVGTYPLTVALSATTVGDYTVTTTNGTLTVTKALTSTTASLTATSALPTGAGTAPNYTIATDPLFIQVATGVSSGIGVPSGTVTVYDVFTPVIATAPGTGPVAAPVVSAPIALATSGTANFLETNQTAGTHVLTVSYSGDSNFFPTLSGTITSGSTTIASLNRPGDLTVGGAITGVGIPANTTVVSIGTNSAVISQPATATLTGSPLGTTSEPLATQTLLVDTADFTITGSSSPLSIAPGVLPGGNSSVAGQAAATPEQLTLTMTSLLSYALPVYVACQPQNPSYVNCAVSPASVTLAANGTATSIVSIQTPATLPLGFFTSELKHPVSTTVLAFAPLGVLAFCFRRRKRLSKILWMLLAVGAISTGLNGCGSTTVAYFTPVPSGAQTVTVYACSVQASCTTSNPITSPLTGTGAGLIRSFTVNINIQ